MALLLALAVCVLALAVSVLAWRRTCETMRKRRLKRLSSLDPRRDSHAINMHTLFVEFPFLSRKSLEFGLFRSYAIPQISGVLQKGGQFACDAAKRYDDTVILVEEMIQHHVDGDRGSLALRRLNFLHSNYPIDNAEYLYVLAVFVLTPIEWSSIYGYREWTELEKAAYYSTWHDIGTRMGIHDIPSSISAFSQYRNNYEAQHMRYADSNREIAEATMGLLLSSLPFFLHPLARRVACSLMDDRLLKAMGYPKQPSWLIALSHCLLKLHGIVVNWMPPRPLLWASMRIPTGSTTSHGEHFNPETLYQLAFQQYKPVFYKKGYRIKELGSIRPGQLGFPCEGDLICPLQECSNLAWPECLSN